MSFGVVRVLLFDIDGTLLTTAGVGNRSLAKALASEFGVKHPDTKISFSGRTDRSLMLELLVRNGLDPSPDHCRRLRRSYTSLLGEQLVRQGGAILPGIETLLQRLQQFSRLDPAVMTGNFPETATQKLEHFQIRQYLSWISGGDAHLDRDDLARRTAEMIVRRHGNRTTDIVVIGDTPADIRCGRAIGAMTVAVATGEYDRDSLRAEEPNHLFDDFSQTDQVIEVLAVE